MKILILGGTGTISRQIVSQSLAAGHEVTLINRGTRKTGFEKDVTTIVADRHSSDFADLVKDVPADVVIDMICFKPEDARQTTELFGDKCRQIIVTSSVAAYKRPTKSIPIREDAEELRDDESFIYGFWKAEIERHLNAQMGRIGAAITIIRPSFTFGEGTANLGTLRQNRNIVRRIKDGKPLITTGEVAAPWSFTFARDLAKAYVLSAGNEKTYNKVYHVTNTELVTWEDLYRTMGRVLGKEPELYCVPSALLKELWPDVCSHLYFEKTGLNYYSNEKFMTDVPEYRPTVSLEEGIREVMDWWEKTDFPYDEEKEFLEDKICALYENFRDDLLKLADECKL